MALILKAISYKGLPPSQEIRAQFDTQGGSIGRAPNNQLVLPDPDKFVSRLHASIVFAAGQFFIQDCSTGGTFLNDSDSPLQQSRAPLRGGEKLRIGEYELLVSISDSVTAGFASVIAQPVRQLDMASNPVLDTGFPPVQHSPAKPADDFFASFVEQPESSAIHQSFTPPKIVETPASSATVDDLDFADLLSTLDALPGTSPKPLQQSELPPLPADFFADEPETTDQAKSEATFETKPEPSFSPEPAETVNLQLEDCDPFALETPVFQSLQQAEDHIGEVNASLQPEALQAASIPAAEMPTDDQLLKAFLAGAGIADTGFITPEQWPLIMRTSGELLRSMVEGLMQVLRARAELKSQFRISVTTMRSVDNNPLKFTPNVDDALKLILAPTNPGFLPPKTAVSEGFRDIMHHQIAMTAGIQAALVEILGSFDPQLIEKTKAEGVLFQKKAKCWEYYVEKYPQLKAVAQEEFFGDAFADAYEKQMLLLSRSAKQP